MLDTPIRSDFVADMASFGSRDNSALAIHQRKYRDPAGCVREVGYEQLILSDSVLKVAAGALDFG